MGTSHVNDALARHNVVVLAIANAILGSQMPILFSVGALAGQMLSPIPCLATLGMTVMYFGSMTATPILAGIMQRRGRAVGFAIGATFGMIGASISALGIIIGSFPIFVAGAFFSGFYHPAQTFMRFAATDNASDDFRPKAISYVLAGGLIAAILGTQIANFTYEAAGTIYVGTYIAIVCINLVGIWVFLFLKPSGLPGSGDAEAVQPRSYRQILSTPGILVAMICAIVSYSLMTLMMTSAPLAIVGCGYAENQAFNVVMAHVLAMFLPSFFTGHLISRYGTTRIIALGLCILALAGVVGFAGQHILNFYGALILLGLGWNFGFIGSTTLLTSQHTPEERGRVQGLNDTVLIGMLMLASLASGGLMNCAGADAVEGWKAVTYAMVPALVLAGVALAWFSAANRRAA